MNKKSITVKTYNVNSQNTVAEIKSYVNDVFSLGGINWNNEDNRFEAASLIEEMLFLMQEDTNGKISHIDVICDRRNNNPTVANRKGSTINLEVRFIEKHCLNVTRIVYTFET